MSRHQNNNRKVKYTTSLKAIHNDQIIRLKQKHSQDLELLDDIKNFALHLAGIEKVYGSALSKTAQMFLAKKSSSAPAKPTSESLDGSSDTHRLSATVWKSLLEKVVKVGDAHLAAHDLYVQEVAEVAKTFRVKKQRAGKQAIDRLKALQLHLTASVHEMEKSMKVYVEDEHEAHVSRQKASAAEEKVRTKSTGLLRSMSSLEKSYAKLQTRKSTQEAKATGSRNRYLLDLTAANAHSNQFYEVYLRDTINMMDHGIYDFLQLASGKLVDKQLECARITEENLQPVSDDVKLINAELELENLLSSSVALREVLHYDYEPQDNDEVSDLLLAYEQDVVLEDEAKKWTERMKGDLKAIEDSRRTVRELWKKICEEKSRSVVAHLMAKRANTQYLMDRAKADKVKAKSRLELIQLSGVEVDIPEDPPEPVEPEEEIRPSMEGEPCEVDVDEGSALDEDVAESIDAYDDSVAPTTLAEPTRLTTDATLHYIDSDISSENINGAMSRDASRDVVKSVEKTLQEEIDNATRALQEDNHVNWNVQPDNVDVPYVYKQKPKKPNKRDSMASEAGGSTKQVRFSSEVKTSDYDGFNNEATTSQRDSIVSDRSSIISDSDPHDFTATATSSALASTGASHSPPTVSKTSVNVAVAAARREAFFASQSPEGSPHRDLPPAPLRASTIQSYQIQRDSRPISSESQDEARQFSSSDGASSPLPPPLHKDTAPQPLSSVHVEVGGQTAAAGASKTATPPVSPTLRDSAPSPTSPSRRELPQLSPVRRQDKMSPSKEQASPGRMSMPDNALSNSNSSIHRDNTPPTSPHRHVTPPHRAPTPPSHRPPTPPHRAPTPQRETTPPSPPHRDSTPPKPPSRFDVIAPISVQVAPARHSYASSQGSPGDQCEESPPPPYSRHPPTVDTGLAQHVSHDTTIDTPPLPPPPAVSGDAGDVSPVAVASMEQFIGEHAEEPAPSEGGPEHMASGGDAGTHSSAPLQEQQPKVRRPSDMTYETILAGYSALDRPADLSASNENNSAQRPLSAHEDEEEEEEDVPPAAAAGGREAVGRLIDMDDDELDVLESHGGRVSHNEEEDLMRPDVVLLDTLVEDSDECESGQTSANSTIEVRRHSGDTARPTSAEVPAHPIGSILLNEDGAAGRTHETNIDDESSVV